jgi:dipeptidyl aminopeptidase/acylaminoacyl peptidase
VWDALNGCELARVTHDDIVSSAKFSPDDARILTASHDSTARIWDARSGVELARLVHNGWINSAAFSPDGTKVVTASVDKTARVWDTLSGAEVAHLCHDDIVSSAAFSPDGARVVTASQDKTARIWDVASAAEIRCLRHQALVTSAAFNADGSRVATASSNVGSVWDVVGGAELVRFTHNEMITSIAISPDGARILTASEDKTVRTWDAESGAELSCIMHNAWVDGSFSPDGMRIVAGSGREICMWDAATGAELARFGHEKPVASVAFSADGTRVVTASHDETARIWDVTWAAKLTGERLVRAVTRERLKGCGRLTEGELRILRPIVGEVDPDVASRWLKPSPDDAVIEAILAQRRRYREVALALVKKDWANRVEEIRADLARRRAGADGTSSNAPSAARNQTNLSEVDQAQPVGTLAHPPVMASPVKTVIPSSRLSTWLVLAFVGLGAVAVVAAARNFGFGP